MPFPRSVLSLPASPATCLRQPLFLCGFLFDPHGFYAGPLGQCPHPAGHCALIGINHHAGMANNQRLIHPLCTSPVLCHFSSSLHASGRGGGTERTLPSLGIKAPSLRQVRHRQKRKEGDEQMVQTAGKKERGEQCIDEQPEKSTEEEVAIGPGLVKLSVNL